jgi:hypothetical protein
MAASNWRILYANDNLHGRSQGSALLTNAPEAGATSPVFLKKRAPVMPPPRAALGQEILRPIPLLQSEIGVVRAGSCEEVVSRDKDQPVRS